jgi:phage terminase large subunit-like protein
MRQALMGLAHVKEHPWLPENSRKLLGAFTSSLDEPSPPWKALSDSFRHLLRTDLWFLIRVGFSRPDFDHEWLYQRCVEVQEHPDGYLDLWARDHRKSTIITYALTIQDILSSHGDDPDPKWGGMEPCFGIFSHTRPIAKAFLRQIKTELERNTLLHECFPDVLYVRPDRDSPRWSEDSGLVVKRRSNPKEATIEAWGLVDGQPTGKHFNVLVYDDVVTRESVTNPEQIQKTTEAWEQSLNLGDAEPRRRMIGTRWSFADSYRTIMERGAAIPRLYPATDDGTLTGKPVLLTEDQLRTKIRDMGPYTASAQLLMNPTVDSKQRFLREWFDHRFELGRVGWNAMNRALICDPASGKKDSDYTAMAVLGIGPDGNWYWLDGVRDRLTLQQRADEYMRLHRRWRPTFCGYEEYGLQADIAYLKERQDRETYRFELVPLKGKLSKFDRVNRLIPLCADGKLWLPEALFRTTTEGKLEDLIITTIEQEFLAWPVPAHDDMIDALSRVFDLGVPTPMPVAEPHRDDRYNLRKRSGSWMAS